MEEILILEYIQEGRLVVEEHLVPLHVPGLSIEALAEFAKDFL